MNIKYAFILLTGLISLLVLPTTFAAVSNDSIIYYLPLDNSTPYYGQCTTCNNIFVGSGTKFVNSTDGFELIGANALIGIGDSAATTQSNFTWSGWVYVLSNSSQIPTIWTKAINGASSDSTLLLMAGFSSSQSMSLYTSTSGSAWTHNGNTAVSTFTNGTWHNLVIRKIGTSLEMFIDGVNKSLTGSSPLIGANLYNSNRGEQYGNLNSSTAGFYPNHRLKSVALWTRALSDAEITEINQSGRTADIFGSSTYTKNITLIDFMANTVTTPYWITVNNISYANGTNVVFSQGNNSVLVTSYVYHNLTTYINASDNTSATITGLLHKFPTQFSTAYIMNKNTTHFYDANNTKNLTIAGTVSASQKTTYINQSYTSSQSATNRLESTQSLFTRSQVENGFTISFKVALSAVQQATEQWIYHTIIGGSNGTEIFFIKDEDSSKNYSIIAGSWPRNFPEVELGVGTPPTANQTYNIVLTYNGSTFRMYSNGVKVDEVNDTVKWGNIGYSDMATMYAVNTGAYEKPTYGNISSFYAYPYALSDESCILGAACAGEIATMYYTPYEYNTAPVQSGLLTITAKDFYTNETLNTFNASINNHVYNTTTGTLSINLTDNQLYTVIVMADNYFNNTYTNVNASSTISAYLSQSIIGFTAYEKVSGNQITGANFTTSYLTNTTHYMKAGTYSVTGSKSGYYSRTISYTASALTQETQNISYMTSSILNVTVRNALTNALITTYTGQLNYSNYSFVENQSTTNGSLYYYIIPGNYTITIDATGYAYTPTNVTLNAGINNVTIYAYITESIFFSIYNEQNNSLLYQPNTTVELIGSYASYNYTTSNNASIFAQLIVPDSYTVRYYATGFETRLGYITVSERSTQNVTLYLLPSTLSTNVTITVLRQDGSKVESALVKVLKYDIDTNSYIIREQILTDYNGEAVSSIELGTEFYKFLVEYPIGTVVLETTPAYITSTDIVLVIPSTQAGLAFENILDVNGDVSYNPSTYNFRFTWSDSGLVLEQACLYVYRIENNYTQTTLGSNCSTSSSGTLLYAVSNSTSAEYYAVGQVLIGSTYYDIDEAWADLRTTNTWGKLGIFVLLALTVTITFIFIRVSPQTAIIGVPVGVALTNQMGITQFASWVPWALIVLSLIIVFAMGRDR